jgi:hypothetical protein
MGAAGVLSEHTLVDGRFELIERVDDRGVGEVWSARDKRGKARPVLVKFLRSLGGETTRLSGELAKHLKALSGLRHANVLTVVHHGLWEGRPFVVHDGFEGASLVAGIEKIRATKQPLAGQAIENLFDRLCAGVEVAHGARPPLVHGLLDGSGVLIHRVPGKLFEVRVMDFGLAQYADAGRATGLRAELTVQCRAMENGGLSGTTVGADVYALGVLLRELVGPEERSDVLAGVRGVIERATAREVGGRPASVKALREELRVAWSGAGTASARGEKAVAAAVAAAVTVERREEAVAAARVAEAPSVVAVAMPPIASAVAVGEEEFDETVSVDNFGGDLPSVEPKERTVMLQGPVVVRAQPKAEPKAVAVAMAPVFAADAIDDRTLEVANMPPDSDPWAIEYRGDEAAVVATGGANDDEEELTTAMTAQAQRELHDRVAMSAPKAHGFAMRRLVPLAVSLFLLVGFVMLLVTR